MTTVAEKQISILLIAKDMASKTIGRVNKQIGTLGKTGAIAGRGLSTLAANSAKVGAVAAVGIGFAVKTGIDNLAELETAVTSVDGAIAQMGRGGKVTGSQIAAWAATIEDSVGAAFDEKPITQATGTLIRYGKLAPGLIQPAMAVMVDLAAKTGDVDSAATLLAKALADPEKAAGKLARQGVILTKAEQEQIKAFMKAGEAGKAQQLILDSLAQTTKGAALASQGPYKRSQMMLADTVEHTTMLLAEGFLPVLERVQTFLRDKLSDPKAIAGIRDLGKGLAGAFDSVVSFAEKVPWGSVMDGMRAVGSAAKMALDAFTAMPAWVQTAVVGGWGLNKLTGGALRDIVGSLASGLVKGVLGLTAGVVNINAGVVNGGGGAGIPTGAAGSAAGGVGIGTAVAGVSALAGGAVILQGIKEMTGQVTATMAGGDKVLEGKLNTLADLSRGIMVGPLESLRRVPESIASLAAWITGSGDRTVDAVGALKYDTRSEGAAQRSALQAISAKTGESIVAFRAAERASLTKPVVNVSSSTAVTVNVSAANVNKSVTIRRRYGTTGGSRDANSGHGK
jgi:hypothetical protein